MRICFITPEYATRTPTGGIANYVRDLALALVERGHSVSVVCATEKIQQPFTQVDCGVTVCYVTRKSIFGRPLLYIASKIPGLRFLREVWCGLGLVEAARGAWHMVKELEERAGRFDVIEATDTKGIAFWALFSSVRRRAIILRGHAFIDLETPHYHWCGSKFQQWLEKFCARRSTFVLTISRYLEGRYVDDMGVNRNRIGHLPYGFNVPVPDRVGQLRTERGWGENDPVVLFVGRIEREKGCHLLFEAVQTARQKIDNLRVVLLGSVTERFEMEHREFLAHTPSWVWHPGPVGTQTVAAWMAEADVLVLPSKSETFGRVVVEAQLHGTPVIATQIGALPEIITNGRTGLLVESDNVEALTTAIIDLCAFPELRQRLSQQARAFAEKRYHFVPVLEKQLQVYEALKMGQSPRPVLEGDHASELE